MGQEPQKSNIRLLTQSILTPLLSQFNLFLKGMLMYLESRFSRTAGLLDPSERCRCQNCAGNVTCNETGRGCRATGETAIPKLQRLSVECHQ